MESISINLSARSVADRSFHQFAADLVRALPFPARRLCLEITETTTITHLVEAHEFVQSMRALGVRIALDDFGAGASSFSYLRTLPIDYLKIDSQYVRSLLSDSLDRTAVRCFRDVAAICGIQTVAECVETEEVPDELRKLRIDFAQGQLIHHPEPLENFALAPSAVAGSGQAK